MVRKLRPSSLDLDAGELIVASDERRTYSHEAAKPTKRYRFADSNAELAPSTVAALRKFLAVGRAREKLFPKHTVAEYRAAADIFEQLCDKRFAELCGVDEAEETVAAEGGVS